MPKYICSLIGAVALLANLAHLAVVNSDKNKSKRFLEAFIRPFVLVATDITDGLGGLIAKPFQVFLNRSKAGLDVSAKAYFWRGCQWPLIVLLAVLSVLLRILLSPVELLTGLIRGNRSSILWALSGLVILSGVVGLLQSGVLRNVDNSGVLRNRAAASFRAGDFEYAAKQYAELINNSPTPLDRDQLNYSIALSQLGRSDQSLEILHTLAPGPGKKTPGYEPAHECLAVSIAAKLNNPEPLTLKVLRWHLDCSGDSQSTEISNAWAKYYLAIGDRQGALKHLKLAAKIHPEYLLMVAEIYRLQGNEPSRAATLEDAEAVFKDRLSTDKTSLSIRTAYSKILFELGQFKNAEHVLLEGQKLTDQRELRTACASLYLSQYQRTKNETDSSDHANLREKFDLLNKSLGQDINHLPTYQELLQLYRESKNDDEREFVVRMLHDNVANNDSVALAHLSLSSILWIQGKIELSRTHMETAFELDPAFAFVVNNLAWILAHDDPPELERAFELADQVVKLNPGDGRFRDTLATILMKQEQYSQALTEFQKAISTADDKQAIHRKMAQIYRSLGKSELAQQHQSKADAN